MASNGFTIKLLVHKEKKRLIYAECGNDFVDVLFSFLTLPTGTIIRLVGNKSEIGCMNKLYDSVKDLSSKHFGTMECKNMLLNPRNAAEDHLKSLMLNVDDTKPANYYYMCSSDYCGRWSADSCLLSTVKNARCRCGELMDKEMPLQDPGVAADHKAGGDEVFVKGTTRYIVTDDLMVMPISTMTSLSMLKKLKINNASLVEERTAKVGKEEVLDLLRYSLISRTPMSNVFVTPKEAAIDQVPNLKLKQKTTSLTERGTNRESRRMRMKLIISKSSSKLLYAEAGEDMVDFFFSFLTYPLGSIAKVLGGNTSMISIDNLYRSVKNLSSNWYIKSQDCKTILLAPKLAPHFGSKNRLRGIEATDQSQYYTSTCDICHELKIEHFVTTEEDAQSRCCLHGKGTVSLTLVDPKCSNADKMSRGEFVKGPAIFLVSDEIVVNPFSSKSLLNKLKVPVEDVVEYVVSIDEDDALNLLKACLVSKSALRHLLNGYCPC